jgi:hypothetical protein
VERGPGARAPDQGLAEQAGPHDGEGEVSPAREGGDRAALLFGGNVVIPAAARERFAGAFASPLDRRELPNPHNRFIARWPPVRVSTVSTTTA